MKGESLAKAAAGLAVVAIAVSGASLLHQDAPRVDAPASECSGASQRDVDLALAALRQEMEQLRSTLSLRGAGNSVPDIEQRLQRLETSVEQLQTSFDGVSLEKASQDRQVLFMEEEGYVKADEYFEAGKFAIAGEGYLAFLSAHPEHPDARNIMGRARDAFLQAGYQDKAFWVQEEMMSHFPENRFDDLARLAEMKKAANRYDDAIAHLEEAMEIAPTAEHRAWKQVYWAWYHQLRDGNEVGLAIHQKVAEEIAATGITNPRVMARVEEKIAEIEAALESP